MGSVLGRASLSTWYCLVSKPCLLTVPLQLLLWTLIFPRFLLPFEYLCCGSFSLHVLAGIFPKLNLLLFPACLSLALFSIMSKPTLVLLSDDFTGHSLFDPLVLKCCNRVGIGCLKDEKSCLPVSC